MSESEEKSDERILEIIRKTKEDYLYMKEGE